MQDRQADRRRRRRLRQPIGRLLSIPTLQGWRFAGLVFVCFAFSAAIFGLATGLFDWGPSGDGLWRVALVALILPALGEEVLFRGPLLWLRRPVISGLLVLAFIAWHPFNASLFLPAALPLFTDPRFLVIVTGLGLANTLLTLRTGSLLPAILIHWLTVVGWKGLFGGPHVLMP